MTCLNANERFLTHPNVIHTELHFVCEIGLQFLLAGGTECWLQNVLLTLCLCLSLSDTSLSRPGRPLEHNHHRITKNPHPEHNHDRLTHSQPPGTQPWQAYIQSAPQNTTMTGLLTVSPLGHNHHRLTNNPAPEYNPDRLAYSQSAPWDTTMTCLHTVSPSEYNHDRLTHSQPPGTQPW